LNRTVYSGYVSSTGFSGPLTLLRLSGGSQGQNRQKGVVIISASRGNTHKDFKQEKTTPISIFHCPCFCKLDGEADALEARPQNIPRGRGALRASSGGHGAVQEFFSPVNAARAFLLSPQPSHTAPEHA